MAGTDDGVGGKNPPAFFLWFYLRVIVWILALVGLCALLGLQFKWFDKVWPPAERFVLEAPAITVKGPKVVFSKETIAVDTSRVYQLGAEVRVLPRPDGSPQTSMFYFGVQTFDASGTELRSGPGVYRYAGAAKMVLSSNQGWVRVGGVITGEGDISTNQFRPATRTVKLVMLPNYQSSGDVSMMIRNVEFSQRVTMVP
ncbi:hypothetical protein [Mesorhizobium sp. SP-1A]|uniref:hypothetical protein n=1 Tax=Mesorhizobium sp. SP-1A TaxID=3077840 RepID=UPI0028F7110A|nr:hypothetical protein [Mesorhizobium sp. SP-1A]